MNIYGPHELNAATNSPADPTPTCTYIYVYAGMYI